MFDVAWTDPSSETVAQHRRRKERDVGRSPLGSRRSSLKSSSSGASSQSQSTSRSGFALFGKVTSKKFSANSKNNEIPSIKPPKDTPSALVLSAYSEPPQDNETQDIITRIQNLPLEYRDTRQSVATTCPSTPAESTFSGPTYGSNRTYSSWGGSVSEASSKPYDNISMPQSRMTSFYQDENYLKQPMNDASISIHENDDNFTVDNTCHFPRVPSHSSMLRSRSPSDHPPRQTSLLPVNRALPEPPRPENSIMRQRIKRMEAANPRIILERLKEDWDDITDDTIYTELEFEKKLWMLVGLRYLTGRAPLTGGRDEGRQPENPKLSYHEPVKFLSLYENQACANLLSAYPPIASRTHHLSLNPLSPLDQTSHLRSLIVATPVSNLPYAPSTFNIINSLRLPVLLPSSSIPTLLQECHRILAPNGMLNLTIMDPYPRATTLGPKLKAWLEENLILKLETQFRCLNPARLMPIWLQDAGFSIAPTRNASGVNIAENQPPSPTNGDPKTVNISFRAIARGEGGYGIGAAHNDKKNSQTEILASTIGRMLWREIYGQFIVSKTWWWEDETIIEEAYLCKTKWDIYTLEAVKQG